MEDVSSIAASPISGETFENWTVSFTSPGGEVKNGRMDSPLVNKTLGYVQSNLILKV